MPRPIPDISVHPGVAGDKPARARSDRELRKALLKEYKVNVVRPVLLQCDREHFLISASKKLPCFGFEFSLLHPRLERIPVSLLRHELGPGWWSWYRIWAFARLTSLWPCPISGSAEAPEVLPSCPLCNEPNITIVHALCVCEGSKPLRSSLAAITPTPAASCKQIFLCSIFGSCTSASDRAAHVRFVGSALQPGLTSVAKRRKRSFSECSG